MTRVQEITAKRQTLEKDLKDVSFDMSKSSFIHGVSMGGDEDFFTICILSFFLVKRRISGSTFLRALGDSGALNEEQISTEKLNEIYGPLREQVSASIKEQENVMAQVQVGVLIFDRFLPGAE